VTSPAPNARLARSGGSALSALLLGSHRAMEPRRVTHHAPPQSIRVEPSDLRASPKWSQYPSFIPVRGRSVRTCFVRAGLTFSTDLNSRVPFFLDEQHPHLVLMQLRDSVAPCDHGCRGANDSNARCRSMFARRRGSPTEPVRIGFRAASAFTAWQAALAAQQCVRVAGLFIGL
jgi:hypothetical protein